MLDLKIQKQLWTANGNITLDVSFQVESNKSLAIYGPSGAGKTSILRMISGLMKPDMGLISFDDKVWFNAENHIDHPPQARKIGYLFQSYALFPNMTVLENIKYAQIKNSNITNELISIMELGALVKLKPQQLSGGQQQRVALARAINRQPKLLLLDEPLSAVDYETSLKLKSYLHSLRDRFPFTLIIVSHNPSDIVALAEKVVCLEDGKIEDSGDPTSLFRHKFGANLNL